MKKSFAVILLLSLIEILLASCQKTNIIEGKSELVVQTIGQTATEEFSTVGFTPLEMLELNHDVKLAFGNVIKCIDGVCAQSGYWWPLYINGRKSSLGPKNYLVRNNDKIEFVLSKR